MADVTDIREAVRERYARAATHAAGGAFDDARALEAEAGCCGPGSGCGDTPTADGVAFGAVLYGEEASGAPASAVEASLGCGVPTAVADLREGEIVLDLGSGAGADVLISATRVGPTGKAIGLDMTDEMLALAHANAAAAGVVNVEFIQGYLEQMPIADQSVDVVISNCVINLSGDKQQVIREAARVLRPGGRFAVSDVIADPDMSDAIRADMAAWTGCIAGALTESEFRAALEGAGLDQIEIHETHRVHEHASAAIIRARKPSRGPAANPPRSRRAASRRRRKTAAGSLPRTARLRVAAARADSFGAARPGRRGSPDHPGEGPLGSRPGGTRPQGAPARLGAARSSNVRLPRVMSMSRGPMPDTRSSESRDQAD